MAGRLTTTSFCLLGLLRLRPFAAYELTKHMQRSALAELWPRTEAALYREASRLVDSGLARARTEQGAKGSRTIYEITPKGRRVFEAWLTEPGKPLTFECEAAVKAFFGDAGDLDTLRSNLLSITSTFRGQAAQIAHMIEKWLEGTLEFPDRIQYTAMAADLIARVSIAADEWAADWLERIDSWDSTELHRFSQEQARSVISDLHEEAIEVADE